MIMGSLTEEELDILFGKDYIDDWLSTREWD